MSDDAPESEKPKVQPTKTRKAKIAQAMPKVSGRTLGVGAAIGIGSAAIVAALLYTNRNKKG